MNRLYETNNIRKQNFLEENGIVPVKEQGKTAYYEFNKKLLSLLERYDIIKDIFYGKY